jgi:predicted AAA+ superfamily ATPase
LLWGPRGTGKSSLVLAILNEYHHKGLKLIQIERHLLIDLPQIVDIVESRPEKFILFCDDLSFAETDDSYKDLKVLLDGSGQKLPENTIVYATSNRRHMLPEYMSENRQAWIQEGELHYGDSTEEKLSLSERFGLRLSFHPFDQEQYLSVVDYWLSQLLGEQASHESVRKEALKWALQHGSRSGRAAWQFARAWAGARLLSEDDKT